jgi:hypothetical protein
MWVQKNIFDIHFFDAVKSTAKQLKTFTFAAVNKSCIVDVMMWASSIKI